jgi:hypothetical protein
MIEFADWHWEPRMRIKSFSDPAAEKSDGDCGRDDLALTDE